MLEEIMKSHEQCAIDWRICATERICVDIYIYAMIVFFSCEVESQI